MTLRLSLRGLFCYQTGPKRRPLSIRGDDTEIQPEAVENGQSGEGGNQSVALDHQATIKQGVVSVLFKNMERTAGQAGMACESNGVSCRKQEPLAA